MTRKQALMRACEILNTYEQTEEITEIQSKVCEVISELPFTAWTEKTIFDTIDQWILENGRVPNTRDLSCKGLPPIPVIRNRFKMQARQFLDTYYPKQKTLCKSERYGDKSQEEWIIYFKEQYNSIKPQTAAEYNKNRGAGMPTWFTIAQICGLNKWNELLDYCGLDKLHREQQKGRERTATAFTVHRESDLEKALLEI